MHMTTLSNINETHYWRGAKNFKRFKLRISFVVDPKSQSHRDTLKCRCGSNALITGQELFLFYFCRDNIRDREIFFLAA